jgi:glutaredoxin
MITIYGKKGCPKCEAAMKKLALLDFRYAYVDVSLPSVFREDPVVVDAQVESALRSEQWPMILIDDRWYDYPEAMAELKRRGG